MEPRSRDSSVKTRGSNLFIIRRPSVVRHSSLFLPYCRYKPEYLTDVTMSEDPTPAKCRKGTISCTECKWRDHAVV